MLRTLRLALRRLGHVPAFSIPAILTLALGVGAVAGVFAILDHVLLEPLPFTDSAQLVDVSHTLTVGSDMHVGQSDATYLLYRRANHVFSAIGAYRATSVNLTGSENATGSLSVSAAARRVAAAEATASLFGVLDVRPLIGRLFSEADDRPGAAPVALISEREWVRLFDRAPNVVGKRIMIDGVSRSVIGVLPRASAFPAANTDLWIPLALDPARTRSAAFDYQAVARLAPHVSISAAATQLDGLLPRVPVVFPGRLTVSAIAQTHMRVVVRPLKDVITGDAARALWTLFGVTGALLLIVSGNIGNLFLARAETRRRELIVRRALGASRVALAADWGTEGAVIVVGGVAIALPAAWLALRTLAQFSAASSIPRLAEVRIDWPVLLVALAAGTLAALIATIIAVARLDAAQFTVLLNASSRSTVGVRHRVRRALVIAQVALALLIVTTAGLFARSFEHLRAVQPGFVAQSAYAFRASLPAASYPSTAATAQFATRALDVLRQMSNVVDVGVSSRLPLEATPPQDSAVLIEDHPRRPGELPNLHEIVFASSGYFSALRIPLIAGRTFDPIDPRGLPDAGSPPVIVSAAFAKQYWHSTQAAVGKRVRMNPLDPWHVIIGVVGDVRDERLEREPSPIVYCPIVTTSAAGTPWMSRDLAFVVRMANDPAAVATGIDRVMRTVDPSVPLYEAGPMAARLTSAMARTTFALTLLAVAAALALAIGALGIYGVLAYIVSTRTREIGIQLALGAPPAHVQRAMTVDALRDAAFGIVLGITTAAALTRWVATLLFGVSAADPVAIGGAASLLLAIAVAASWWPARRASQLDPALALRAE